MTSGPSERWRALRGPAFWSLQLGLVVAYFGAAKLGLSMAFLARQVSPVWPPTGLALAAVVLLGRRAWPAVALGAFAANATADEPLLTAAGIAAGNTLEALGGAWLLTRGRPFSPALDRLGDALAVILAAALGTAIAATIGVTSLCLGGVVEWSGFTTLWAVWWLGDALGTLVVAPPLLCWLGSHRPAWPTRRTLELGGGLLAATVCSWWVFRGEATVALPAPALEYCAFPFLVWAAWRFGSRGASLVTLSISAVAIAGTLGGGGPYALRSAHEGLVLLQTYTAVVAMTGLLLASAIAERNRAQVARRAALRRRAEQLADADRRKNEFLAMLGHELRNPLAAIHSGLEVLRAAGSESPAGQRMIAILDRQVANLTRLVEDLLEVGRISRGEITLNRQWVDLRATVSAAIETAQAWVDERRQELAVRLPAEPLLVEIDPIRLEQVVINLLHNASKYSAPGGRLELQLEREDGMATLRVRDDGIGIAAELMPHIFEPFVQGEEARGSGWGGLGVGLTLVRRIVEAHGGSVAASSPGPGLGSELVVRLPAAAAAG